jgi:diadenosine tetraphosphate (Ap4A) HIT family hydrolase
MRFIKLTPAIFLFLAFPLFSDIPKPLHAPRAYDLLRGENLKICVPACYYCDDALEIQNIGNHQRFCQWNAAEQAETYDLLQRIANTWNKSNYAHNYLAYGMTTPNLRCERFSWAVIPYPDNGWNRLKQIRVIWNVAFGSPQNSDEERVAKANSIKEQTQYLSDPYMPDYGSGKPAKDAFCDGKVIENQRVFEGKRINVFYDRAPERIVDENPHFLITPKRHAVKLTELTEDEYTESMETAQKIANYFQRDNPRCTLHMLHKTGEAAGQTVPHWHLHVIVVKDDAYLPSFQFPCVKSPTSCTRISSPFLHLQRQFGRIWQGCQNFIYLMLPNRKLTDEELNERVAFYSREFEQSF